MIGNEQEFEVYKIERTSDGMGGFTETYTLLRKSKGVISNPSAKRKAFLGTLAQFCDYIIFTEDTDIEPDYIIGFNGKKYVISGITNPNMLNHHLEIMITDVSKNKSINR